MRFLLRRFFIHRNFSRKRNSVDEEGKGRFDSKNTKGSALNRYLDSDEEERLAEEESRQELYGKKVTCFRFSDFVLFFSILFLCHIISRSCRRVA